MNRASIPAVTEIRIPTVVALCLALVACGGGGDAGDETAPSSTPAASPPEAATSVNWPAGPLTMPDWVVYDEATGTVGLEIVAGATDAKNYWNFNGYTDGAIAITVPLGATVTIDFSNQDPVMAHSLGISRELQNFAMPPAPEPAFAGAITPDATSMVTSTLSGESETIQFIAEEAGRYSMVCYIAGHTAVGMWVYFEVSDDGSVGVRGL
ncbi:MAG: hypothetical protein HKN72_13265 [Gemmatimonadetes bacterium]|nr:hypothetical protein [Gemmatimonadota bacterium]NNF14193.1 hypothetical protein [Gemmatimonadota bacterium]NNL30809.1 hypothetical protein [Gemmatimonadota bacterium]